MYAVGEIATTNREWHFSGIILNAQISHQFKIDLYQYANIFQMSISYVCFYFVMEHFVLLSAIIFF